MLLQLKLNGGTRLSRLDELFVDPWNGHVFRNVYLVDVNEDRGIYRFKLSPSLLRAHAVRYTTVMRTVRFVRETLPSY